MAYGLIVSGLTLIAQDIPNALTGEGLKAFGATTGSHARATAYSPASFGQREVLTPSTDPLWNPNRQVPIVPNNQPATAAG